MIEDNIENIIGGDVVLEENKAVTVPNLGSIQVEPTSGYDAMKMVTVTNNALPLRCGSIAYAPQQSGQSTSLTMSWSENVKRVVCILSDTVRFNVTDIDDIPTEEFSWTGGPNSWKGKFSKIDDTHFKLTVTAVSWTTQAGDGMPIVLVYG